MTERVAVLLDFQNVHLVGHGIFSRGIEAHRCVLNPGRLADLIASKRRRPSVAAAVRVFRGRPDPGHQARLTASNDAQAAQWTRDQRVQVMRRQLVYRDWPNLPPVEKGIDVAVAVDLMRLAFGRQYDALVLFSSDSDLMPALEAVVEMRLTHVEVACWRGGNQLRFPGTSLPWCHSLTDSDWTAVVDDWQRR
ncbi:MAG: NYN domain-containing protein [Streptosporangiaceae bacterium]